MITGTRIKHFSEVDFTCWEPGSSSCHLMQQEGSSGGIFKNMLPNIVVGQLGLDINLNLAKRTFITILISLMPAWCM
jgi:hypothetical protein